MIVRIDAMIINKIEKLAQKTQQLTGKTNFFFARLFAGISVILYLSDIISGRLEIRNLPLVIAMACCFFLFPLRIVEKIAFFELKCGISNELKIAKIGIIIRLGSIFLNSLGLITEVALYEKTTFGMNYSFFIFGLYLESCDPLPPCRSKAIDLIKEFFTSKKLMEAKTN